MQTAYSKVQNHVFLAKIAMFRNYFTQVNDGELGTWALLNSVKKFTEIQIWVLLTFFICLHNQLNSFSSIIVQMSEERD